MTTDAEGYPIAIDLRKRAQPWTAELACPPTADGIARAFVQPLTTTALGGAWYAVADVALAAIAAGAIIGSSYAVYRVEGRRARLSAD